MKIVVSGYYGYDNLGDEAVLESIVKGLKERLQIKEITVLSAAPSKTAERYQVNAVSRYSWIKIFQAVRSSDLLISGGGTLLQDATSSRSLFYYLGIMCIGLLCRKKIAVLAQGFGPLRGRMNCFFTRLILNRINLITLRDEDSFNRLKRLGIKNRRIYLTADPTFLLGSGDKEKGAALLKLEGIEKNQPLIGVAIRNLKHHPVLQKIVFKALAESLDNLVRGEKVLPVFLLFQPENDTHAAEAVIELMHEKSALIFRRCTPSEMLAIIADLDYLIGIRLHALIFAAINSIPMLGISYDPKVESFIKSIAQDSLAINEKLTASLITDKLQQIMTQSGAIQNQLTIKNNQLYHLAEVNFSLLEELLFNENRLVDFSGIQVDNVTIAEAMQRFESLMGGKGGIIVTPNPEMIVAAQTDQAFREMINSADLKVPDGISMVVVSRLLRRPLKERVTGIDLMNKIVDKSAENGYRIYLLGGAPGVASAAADKLKLNYPSLRIVGTADGYFKAEEEGKLINKIRESCADILFVGLGAGRQEKWLNHHLNELGIKVGVCIGGSMDVISGRKKRAPIWIQKLYIEWLYRLITEPQRWKRQLALPKFLWLMFFSRR